jgi:lysophospholipase L1-like esterase
MTPTSLSGMRRADAALSALAVAAITAAVGVLTNQPAPITGDPVSTVTLTRRNVVVLGDSYAGGSSMDSGPGYRWPALLANRDNFNVHVQAVGGSGFTVDGPGKPDTSIPDQAQHITRYGTPDVVVIMAARNDIHQSAVGKVGAAVTTTLATIHRHAPAARVLLVGPVWAGDVTPSLYRVFATLEWRADKAAGGAYIDGATQPGPWLKGHPEMIGTDHVHPNDQGHALMADKINPALQVALRSPAQ